MSLFRNRNKKFEDDLQQQLGNHEVKPSGSLWDKLDQELGEGGFEQKVQTKLDNFEVVPYSDTWQKIESQLPLEPVSNPWLRYLGASLVALLFISGVYIGYQLNTPEGGAGKQVPGSPKQITEAASAGNTITENKQDIAAVKQIIDEEALTDKQEVRKKRSAPVQETPANNLSVTGSSATSRKVSSAPERINQSNQMPVSSGKDAVTEPSPVATINKNKKPLVAAVNKSAKQSQMAVRNAERQQQGNAGSVKTTGNAVSAGVIASAGHIPPTAKADENVHTEPGTPKTSASVSATVDKDKANGGVAVLTEKPVGASHDMAQKPEPVSGNQAPENTTGSPAGIASNQGDVTGPVSAVSDSAKQAYLAAGKQADEKYDEEKPGNFSMLIMVGGHYSMIDLKAPSSSNLPLDDNIALRRSLEKPQIDWSGGFYVDYMLNDKWRVSAGIGMLNFSQQFYYDTKPASGATNGAGESGAGVLYPNDSILGGNKFNTRIRYSWTEFPLLVTYKITNSPKWNIEVQGGVSYAVLSAIDAAMVSYDNTGLLVLKTEDAFPGLQNSVFAMINPTIAYTLNEKVTIGIMPTFKYSINSMVKKENWVQQHPYFAGLALSLRRRF